MQQSIRYLVALSLLSQLFIACKKDSEHQPAEQSGYFVVTGTSSSSAASGRTTGAKADTYFNLGSLKASKAFVFMLANGGNKDIFDITLASNEPAFEVSPQRLQRLPGRGSSGIVQLITVGVTHGVQLNSPIGQSQAPNLPKGLHETRIAIKGKTLVDKDTIEVTGDFTVAVEALVVDAKIVCGGQDVVRNADQWGNEYWYVYPVKTVQMVNTGNVAIKVDITYQKIQIPAMSATYTRNQVELLPGTSKDITGFVSPAYTRFTEGGATYEYLGQTTLSILPTGTVTNITGFNLHSM